MNWRKRKKRNHIMKHYGFWCWSQYQMHLRISAEIQRYTELNWFTNYEDRYVIARHIVVTDYVARYRQRHHLN